MTILAIKKSLSSRRLSTYLLPPFYCKTDAAAIGGYLWNQEICSIMSSVLHTVEIALRNAIYDGYLNYVKEHIKAGTVNSTAANIQGPVKGNPAMWFRMAFTMDTNKNAVEIINKVRSKLKTEKKALIPDNYIAKLTLGFWVSLVDKAYDINSPNNTTGLILWPPIRSDVFPNATRNNIPLTINEIRDELKYINQLRNRLAHHEPLWKDKLQFDRKSVINKVITDYQRCVTVINWINPSMTRLLSMVENNKRISELCDLTMLENMMMLPVNLEGTLAEDLLANLSLIDETIEGNVLNIISGGCMFIKDDQRRVFFASKSQIVLGENGAIPIIGDRVKFIGRPSIVASKGPIAEKVSII